MSDSSIFRFCQMPRQPLAISARPSRAKWRLAGSLPGVSDSDLRRAIQSAFDAWSAVANCSAVEAQAGQSADLVISTGRIDGPLGILAQTELPYGGTQHMLVDSTEAWIIRIGQLTGGTKLD